MFSTDKINKHNLISYITVEIIITEFSSDFDFEPPEYETLHLADDLDYTLGINHDELLKKKKQYLKMLSKVDRRVVEIETRSQAVNSLWHKERHVRLTASRFGEVCKMRNYTSCKKKVHMMLYQLSPYSPSLAHGNEMEPIAKNNFEKIKKISVQPCGLFIDQEFPFLGASPDGLIDENSIIEIKCPYKAKNTRSAIEAVNRKMLPYCTIKNGVISLKKNHSYYYQIMGQLRVTGKKMCYFVVHTKYWTNIEQIFYDHLFWETQMFNKLKLFYMECLLPEIVDPLYHKRYFISDIRDPDYIIEAQKEVKEKKIKKNN